MNRREAIKALADGKLVCHPKASLCQYLEMNFKTGQIERAGGYEATMESYEDGWQLYEEPNPHPKGTFAWAREEAKRGKYVGRQKVHIIAFGAQHFESNVHWTIESFEATDWSVYR